MYPGGRSEIIQRALNSSGTFLHYVGVDHGCGDIGVAEQFLQGTDVIACFKKVSCEGVPKAVAATVFCNSGADEGLFYGALQGSFIGVVSADLACKRVS